MTSEAKKSAALPVACTLTESDLAQRASELRQGLARRIRAKQALENGIAFRFDLTEESVADLEAFVTFERHCCGFAEFELRRDEPSGAIWLEIRGPEGTATMFSQLVT